MNRVSNRREWWTQACGRSYDLTRESKGMRTGQRALSNEHLDHQMTLGRSRFQLSSSFLVFLIFSMVGETWTEWIEGQSGWCWLKVVIVDRWVTGKLAQCPQSNTKEGSDFYVVKPLLELCWLSSNRLLFPIMSHSIKTFLGAEV